MSKLKTVPCIVLAAGAVIAPATAHAAEPDLIVFQQSRPVAQAALVLSEVYGQVITYEDPPYVYEGDLLDETDPNYAREHPGDRALVPASRTLTVDRSVWPAVTTGANLAVALEALMKRNEHTGGPLFRVLRTGGLIHIVPARARNANGDWIDVTSVLEVQVTIARHRTNGIGALTRILEAVSAKAGIKVSPGTFPINPFVQHQTDLAAEGESARTVIMRVLAGIGFPLSWHLYYGPEGGDEPGSYAMNVLPVSRLPTASQ